jgi:hypothetical protein
MIELADNRIARVSLPAYLQAITIGFVAPDMVADILAPRLPVGQIAGKYRVFGKNNLIERKADWHPGMIPNAIETRWSDAPYLVEMYKLRTMLLDAEVANNNSAQLGGMDLAGIYTQNVTQAIAIAREKRVAQLFTNSANYPGGNVITKAGGAEWNTVPASVLTDLITLLGTIADTAMVPRARLTLAIPEPVFRQSIMFNSTILDAIKYSQLGVVTQQLLAALLGVKQVMLVQSMTAGPGPEVAGSDVITGYTTSYLWGDTVWAGLVAGDGRNDMDPSFARSFNWAAGTGGQVRRIRRYRMADEGQEGDWIECTEAMDERITYSGAGGVIKNTSSTF